MNDKDLHTILTSLASVNPRLPRHQQALRARLIAHGQRRQTYIGRLRAACITLTKGVSMPFIKRNNLLRLGAPALLVAAIVIGAVMVTTPGPVSAQQVVMSAAQKLQQMNPADVEELKQQLHQDVSQRLHEAQSNRSLRMLPENELNALPGELAAKTMPGVTHYVIYTDAQGHRIVMAFAADNEPLYVYDVDASTPAAGNAKQPNMQIETH